MMDSPRLTRQAKQAGKLRRTLLQIRDAIPFPRNIELITFISKIDSLFEGNLSSQNRFIIPNMVETLKVEKSSSPRMIYIASGKYFANRENLRMMLSEAMCDFLAKENLYLHVVGSDFDDFPRHKNVRFEGFVADLTNFYKSKDVHLAPIISRAGIKNKVVQPYSYGINVITTASGSNGLDVGRNLHVCSSISEFPKKIQDLIKRDDFGTVHKPVKVFEFDETLKLLSLIQSWKNAD